MHDINSVAASEETRLSRIDLNLLLVFEAILRERSVTKAGDRLGLSQPAMSHALNRLRHLMKDQLFVRAPEGMTPTPRAERLAEPVRNALLELRSALEAEEFVPEETRQRFVVAVNNYAAIALVGPILRKARALAPHMHLSFRPSGTLDVAGMLDRAELDIALLANPLRLSRFSACTLIEDDYVGVVRRGHPILDTHLDMSAFARLPHLTISSSGDDLSVLDAQMDAAGLSRPISVEAPYLSAGSILTQSDMMAVMGRQIGEEFRRAYAVQLVELPLQPAPLRSTMVWHSRFQDHAAHQWMRGTILSAAMELYPPDHRSDIRNTRVADR